MPQGTFRRMLTSAGLVHADTSSLLSTGSGEYSANIYIKTPPHKGALNVYPVQQYSMAQLPFIYALSKAQQAAYSADAQESTLSESSYNSFNRSSNSKLIVSMAEIVLLTVLHVWAQKKGGEQCSR